MRAEVFLIGLRAESEKTIKAQTEASTVYAGDIKTLPLTANVFHFVAERNICNKGTRRPKKYDGRIRLPGASSS